MKLLTKFISSCFLALFVALITAAPAAYAVEEGMGPGPYGYPSGSGAQGAGEVDTLGSVIQNLIDSTSTLPGLLAGFSYLAGLVFGFMFIIKIKDHVEDPRSVPIWDPMKRLIVAGSFFALPNVISAVISLVDDGGGNADYKGSKFNGEASGSGLDAMIVKLMEDIFVPAQFLFGWFGYVAGIILVIIGILRMMKTEEQGVRGPTGIGTIMTFIVAACLFSLNAMIGDLTTTLFGDSALKNKGILQYTDGLDGAETHIHAVISAIIAFSILLGWISLIRGFFIFRGVSEGNSQASMMAAITHIIGGIMAINLGNIIMAVQNTLGISQYGIIFS